MIVPDYQLSLAIGKEGQNARLAARLTGYKIDIKSETQAKESGLFEEMGIEYQEDMEDMEVYISAIGGMQELYDVMSGSSSQSGTADQYFDDMMSVYFSPKMMTNVIGYMEDYLAGNWEYEVGEGKYEVVWIVDKNNVSEYEGFTGH